MMYHDYSLMYFFRFVSISYSPRLVKVDFFLIIKKRFGLFVLFIFVHDFISLHFY
uniref:Uncharacterized protein n=1 Tax=Anguilla anguilla TaxID=7936 RepID=A0A0E9S495_ANGAN